MVPALAMMRLLRASAEIGLAVEWLRLNTPAPGRGKKTGYIVTRARQQGRVHATRWGRSRGRRASSATKRSTPPSRPGVRHRRTYKTPARLNSRQMVDEFP
jgi:hypothetical protein